MSMNNLAHYNIVAKYIMSDNFEYFIILPEAAVGSKKYLNKLLFTYWNPLHNLFALSQIVSQLNNIRNK